ncbi:helix-turn-helix domain-containing protein [Nocardia huaxiensis]|uniref:Helix-turn-helix domain-containing protein n=1 Tax=Nocardia huaxiensis TaxID=2755382 RepID=A0A7D6V814_9NOCA|nr:helix-turn-helix transcriptional regulator [Nocardia huaxiensis]QLY29932.1 helix-turn-helix domain-containing protein [Nocardia huaxiensis]UFS96482.1 helix-turn-helix domain-containing protein [Nocardia huaxiensis]
MAAPSTLPRILLGLELKNLREGTTVKREDAAELSGISKPTLWRIESGLDVRLNPVLIQKLCEVYDATPEQTNAILALVQEAAEDKDGWWHAFSDAIPKEFNLFVSLENRANHLVSYQTTFLPGQLQTLEYRRALSWIEFPDKSSRDTERMLQVAMKRQERLTSSDNPLQLAVLIDESVLRRDTGGPEVMATQLKHLSAMGELPNVSVRVVPASAGTYQGLFAGTFVLFEFPDHPNNELTRPPIVYVQGYAGGRYDKQPDVITKYRGVLADTERLALDEGNSRQLILSIAKEYST